MSSLSLQPLQGLGDGPPLGGDILAERRGLAPVFPDLPVPSSGRKAAELSEPSRPGAVPQHLRPQPPDQSAPGHPAAPDCQFRQRGSVDQTPPTKVCQCKKSLLWASVFCLLLEALQVRRSNCEHQHRDPIVWTCHRVMKWIRDIDLKVHTGCHTNQMNCSMEFTFKIKDVLLWRWCFIALFQEFADNLQGKGIHGALMTLDPSFDTETMAKALGIPGNKHMLHRHLYEELKSLTIPHR